MSQDNTEIKKEYPAVSMVQFAALGTEIELRIVVKDEFENESAKKHLEEVRNLYAYYEKKFSRFDLESELSKLNVNLNSFNAASTEMIEVVFRCLKFNLETGGIFDPRIIDTLEAVGYKNDFKEGNFVLADGAKKNDKNKSLCDDLIVKDGKVFFGTRMDFSGIVKGYITDKISQFLIEKGWKNFLVDSGGDMYLLGNDQTGAVWRIDIDGIPHEKMMLALNGKGIATSGISKRKWEIDGKKFHHLINPKEREKFSFDLKTVTVVANSTEEADIWAKTLFLMGKDDGISKAKENSIGAVFLDYRGGAWISPEIKKFIL